MRLTESQNLPEFEIRLARRDDARLISLIEDEAGSLFSGLGLIDESNDQSFDFDELIRLIDLDLVWICCTDHNQPVGALVASVWEHDSALYIEELDVLPKYGQRGIGTRLLLHACNWARDNGHRAAILSTFYNVPWNAPFYRKNGFMELTPHEWSPRMYLQREREVARGLPVEFRVFMKKDLSKKS